MNIRSSIFLKMLVSTITIILGLLVFMTVMQVVQQQKLLQKESARRLEIIRTKVYEQGKSLAHYIRRISNDSENDADLILIIAKAANAVKLEKTVLYFIYTENDGNEMVNYAKPDLDPAQLSDDLRAFALQQHQMTTYEYVWKKTGFIEYIIPVKIMGEQRGVVRLGYTLADYNSEMEKSIQDLKKQIRHLIMLSIVTAIVFLIISCGLVYLFSRQITRPIQKLTQAARDIAGRNFSSVERIEIISQDEVGELAETFNQMITNLKHTHVKLEDSYKKLEEANRTLEDNVNIRTAELKTANRELKNFAYIVSHDLKAPLRAIGSLANFIRADYGDKFDEDGKEQMNLLLSRVQRMYDLIEGILSYSKIGRDPNRIVKVDLVSLVPEIVDLLGPQPHHKITIAGTLPTIEYDPTQIHQVFQNLISNAMKYNDKSEAIIKIGYEDDGKLWKFYISDNGCGIDSQFYDKIFKIFQVLQARDDFESTGIGLTVVKKIIELHGGSIWVESTPGVGSVFYFTVPKQSIQYEKNAIHEDDDGSEMA